MMRYLFYIYAYIFGRSCFVCFNQFLFLMSTRALGIYNYQNFTISGEKWFLKNIIKKSGKSLVVFDVGANKGDYCKNLISSKICIKKIYAFEPQKDVYTRLKSNTVSYPIISENIALSDTVGESLLFDRNDNEGSCHASLSEKIFTDVHKVSSHSFKTNISTIDEYCKTNSINFIDFLKIDVEGYELNVLKGGSRMLSERRIKIIQFEFTQLNTVLKVSFRDFYDLLSMNYTIYRLLPFGLKIVPEYNSLVCEISGYQNFCAISNEN